LSIFTHSLGPSNIGSSVSHNFLEVGHISPISQQY
jgi:hypothetical protein